MSPARTAANQIQSALRQRGVFYTHPVYGTDDVFTTESIVKLNEEAYAGAPVAVKARPLTWHHRIDTLDLQMWDSCHEPLRLWEIDRYDDDPRYHLRILIVNGAPTRGSYDTLEAAQTAAQEEWDSFIQAAIQP